MSTHTIDCLIHWLIDFSFRSFVSSWEYIGRKAHRKDVSLLRRGMPDQIYNVDAAFYWSKARKVYIFKGNFIVIFLVL